MTNRGFGEKAEWGERINLGIRWREPGSHGLIEAYEDISRAIGKGNKSVRERHQTEEGGVTKRTRGRILFLKDIQSSSTSDG